MRTATLGLMALAGVALSSAAPAQENTCQTLEDIVAELDSKHGESAASMGLSSKGYMSALFANPETGTWTLVVFGANGCGGIMDYGYAFQPPTEALKPKRGSDV